MIDTDRRMSETILDTCCLINLYASQSLEAIIKSSTEKALVSRTVLGEILYVRQPDDEDPDQLVPEEVRLGPFIERRVLHPTDLSGDVELERFVTLASVVDDGEAACLAIAASRGLVVATDDRRAIRVAAELGVSTVSTPELVKTWVKNASPEPIAVTHAIKRIERYGKFRPHFSSPYLEWWSGFTEDL